MMRILILPSVMISSALAFVSSSASAATKSTDPQIKPIELAWGGGWGGGWKGGPGPGPGPGGGGWYGGPGYGGPGCGGPGWNGGK